MTSTGYINNIGKYHEKTKYMLKVGERTKFQMLTKYKKALMRRELWGAINRDMVLAHLDLVLSVYARG